MTKIAAKSVISSYDQLFGQDVSTGFAPSVKIIGHRILLQSCAMRRRLPTLLLLLPLLHPPPPPPFVPRPAISSFGAEIAV